MKKHARNRIGRRQALQRLMSGAGATAALPTLSRAKTEPPTPVMPGMPTPDQPSLGAAEPPDPSLASADWKPKFFDEHENETVVVLSDLIIPTTDTPGAKAAQVNRFIDLYLAAVGADEQKQYLQALAWLDGQCLAKYGKPFTGLFRTVQGELLGLLSRRSSAREMSEGARHFQTLKSSIVEAYYSSEVGALQELKYQTNPFQAEFPGCKNTEEH